MRATRSMTFLFCSAFFGSWAPCNRIHNSGEPPKRRDTFRHMTVDRGLRPARMSCSIWRDTPKAFAGAVTDRPVEGRMSSLIVSPGWMGGSPFFLSTASSLMVLELLPRIEDGDAQILVVPDVAGDKDKALH